MIKILPAELFESTFTHKISKYASRTTLETLLFSLLYEIHLRNLAGRGLHLSRKMKIITTCDIERIF